MRRKKRVVEVGEPNYFDVTKEELLALSLELQTIGVLLQNARVK